MSKKYRCVEVLGGGCNFTAGKVYVLDESDRLHANDGFPFGPHYPSTVVGLENKGWYKFEEVKDMEFIKDGKINLDALKTGDWIDVVETNGDTVTYQVMKDTPWGVVFRAEPSDTTSVVYVEGMALDDTIEVCAYTSISVRRGNLFIALCDLRRRPTNLVFEWHEEVKRKKMTVDEIEAVLGYKVAIVDKDGVTRG